MAHAPTAGRLVSSSKANSRKAVSAWQQVDVNASARDSAARILDTVNDPGDTLFLALHGRLNEETTFISGNELERLHRHFFATFRSQFFPLYDRTGSRLGHTVRDLVGLWRSGVASRLARLLRISMCQF